MSKEKTVVVTGERKVARKTMSAAIYRHAYSLGVLNGFGVKRPTNLSAEVCNDIEQAVVHEINYAIELKLNGRAS